MPGLVCYLDGAAADGSPPLSIVGPPGAAAFLRGCLLASRTELKNGYVVKELAAPSPAREGRGAAYEAAALEHLAARPSAKHPDERPGSFVEPNADGVWKDVLPGSSVTVEAAPLSHGTIACVGYRFEEPTKAGALDAAFVKAAAAAAGDDARRLFREARAAAAAGISVLTLADGTALDVKRCFVGGVTARPGRAVVILGDCAHPGGAAAPPALALARRADLLVHEATLDDSLAALAEERGHSTPSDAARFASTARARALALWHFSPRYRCDEAFVDAFLPAARAAFAGDVVLAADFLRVAVARRGDDAAPRPPAPPETATP